MLFQLEDLFRRMREAKRTCAKCGHAFVPPEQLRGVEVTCPSCGTKTAPPAPPR